MTDRAIILRALTAFGHTPAKALEIAIDAERKDAHAVEWVNRALDGLCVAVAEHLRAEA